MSDMYLELRSRIPVVASRTHVGTARLQEAQDAIGLSNEGIARLIPVSEKTWRRWKDAGDIPTAALPAVAKALRLELRAAQTASLPLTPSGGAAEEDPVQVEILRTLQSLVGSVDALTDRMERLEREAVPGRRTA